jgi:hypothetical protein
VTQNPLKPLEPGSALCCACATAGVLCSLPAAAALDSEQVLQLFEVASQHDGVRTAQPTSRSDASDDSSDDEGYGALSNALDSHVQRLGRALDRAGRCQSPADGGAQQVRLVCHTHYPVQRSSDLTLHVNVHSGLGSRIQTEVACIPYVT